MYFNQLGQQSQLPLSALSEWWTHALGKARGLGDAGHRRQQGGDVQLLAPAFGFGGFNH
jgi:hypothetical protein